MDGSNETHAAHAHINFSIRAVPSPAPASKQHRISPEGAANTEELDSGISRATDSEPEYFELAPTQQWTNEFGGTIEAHRLYIDEQPRYGMLSHVPCALFSTRIRLAKCGQ